MCYVTNLPCIILKNSYWLSINFDYNFSYRECIPLGNDCMEKGKASISELPKKVQDALNGGGAFLEGSLQKLYFMKKGETECTVYTGSVNEIQRKIRDLINEGVTLPCRVAKMAGKTHRKPTTHKK